ncbi:MAG: hypothetical protein LC776_15190, partial [Acidobacteria bacterium]|nr:hypothetical protein [Acidobacteriota bacterium]
LILAIRPVVTLEDESTNGVLPRPVMEASTLVRRISVDVSVPPDQWIAERFDSATALVTSTEGFVVSVTALLAAVIGLRLAFRRHRRKQVSDADVTPE